MIRRREFLKTAAVYWEHEGDRSELRDLVASDTERAARMSALYDRWAAHAKVVPWDQLPKAGTAL